MNQPSLYKRANGLQRYDAKKFMDEFADVLQLRSDGRDSLIDIGCGSGDVLMDFIFPILPDTYTKVVEIDIAPNMIQYSKKTYAAYDKVDFEVLDIETDDMPFEFHEQFDHVTSFYCLHWVQNQRQALENIYNMLVNGGDCLLAFMASCSVFDVYTMQSKNPKWNEYLKDVEKYIPPSQNDPYPCETYTMLLKQVGFIDHTLEIRKKTFIFEGYESYKVHLTSVNPFIERIPFHEREVFINEMVEILEKMGWCKKIADKDDYRYMQPYKMAVVYAKK